MRNTKHFICDSLKTSDKEVHRYGSIQDRQVHSQNKKTEEHDAGIILGVKKYAPDTTKKAICVGFGLALLCAGWFLRYKIDQAVSGR